MGYLTSLWFALCIPAGVLCARELPQLSPAEQEVLNVSQARRDAANKRDTAVMASYIADGCLLSAEDGTLITKDQLLESYKKLPVEYELLTNAREFVVRLYGNTAVINFRVNGHEKFGDTDLITEQRRTETWLKQNGSWLLIAVQWGNLPVNLRKPVALDAKVFEDYVGEYHSRPGDDAEIVFVKNGKLWSQSGKEIAEYLPAGGDSFFLKEGDLGTITFCRDAQGHVSGYTYHRTDGQEIQVKKTK